MILSLKYSPYLVTSRKSKNMFKNRSKWASSWPGIEPVPSAVQGHNPNHWTSREFPNQFLI